MACVTRYITSGRAELVRTGLAVPTTELGVAGVAVPVPCQARAAEPPEVVDASTELAAVVVIRLTALVEILNSGDGVERPGHIEITIPYIVGSSLNNLNQLSLDVPFHKLRLGVGILLHFYGRVHSHCSIHLVELVHFTPNENWRERCQRHSRVDLKYEEGNLIYVE